MTIFDRFFRSARGRLLHQLAMHGADGMVIITFQKQPGGILVDLQARFPTMCPTHDRAPDLVRAAADQLAANIAATADEETVH